MEKWSKILRSVQNTIFSKKSLTHLLSVTKNSKYFLQIKYSLHSTHDTDLQKKLKSLYILKVLTKSETGCDIF